MKNLEHQADVHSLSTYHHLCGVAMKMQESLLLSSVSIEAFKFGYLSNHSHFQKHNPSQLHASPHQIVLVSIHITTSRADRRQHSHILLINNLSSSPTMAAFHPTVGALRLPAPAPAAIQTIDLDLLPSDGVDAFCHHNDPDFAVVDPDTVAEDFRAAISRQADLQVLFGMLLTSLRV